MLVIERLRRASATSATSRTPRPTPAGCCRSSIACEATTCRVFAGLAAHPGLRDADRRRRLDGRARPACAPRQSVALVRALCRRGDWGEAMALAAAAVAHSIEAFATLQPRRLHQGRAGDRRATRSAHPVPPQAPLSAEERKVVAAVLAELA
ncbi:MAG: hypothetical protein MZV49_17225 [Rhodopseudomonas palustris]|nr:hypothetical protein [Rhodopseudomonas palustris]